MEPKTGIEPISLLYDSIALPLSYIGTGKSISNNGVFGQLGHFWGFIGVSSKLNLTK